MVLSLDVHHQVDGGGGKDRIGYSPRYLIVRYCCGWSVRSECGTWLLGPLGGVLLARYKWIVLLMMMRREQHRRIGSIHLIESRMPRRFDLFWVAVWWGTFWWTCYILLLWICLCLCIRVAKFKTLSLTLHLSHALMEFISIITIQGLMHCNAHGVDQTSISLLLRPSPSIQ